MGLVGKLFGLGLVIAGLFIALYWTAWVLMILVIIISVNIFLIIARFFNKVSRV
jgi:hypothetical protein